MLIREPAYLPTFVTCQGLHEKFKNVLSITVQSIVSDSSRGLLRSA